MDDHISSRKKEAWTFALVIVSVLASGVVLAGLLQPEPEPELTTAPPMATAESEAPAPDDYVRVEEPVDLNADIPGCDTVEKPDESGGHIAISIFRSSEQTYDNPKFPWYSGPKATAMSDAVADLLPDSAEIEFASPERSLIFRPITDFGESDAEPKGSAIASGSVVNGNARGSLTVQVQQGSPPIPTCVAGYLDERRTLPDGVVVDLHDTWWEVNGVRTLSRSAQAYVTDGSLIHASSTDQSGTTQQDNSGIIPLTTNDLVRIVGDPRLRTSTNAPPGTPAPREGCPSSFDVDGPAITRGQARKLDTALAKIDLGGPTLPPLQPGKHSNTTLCTGISDVKSNTGLDISISGGQPLPTPERPVPGSGSLQTMRTLDDGTVVQTNRVFRAGSPMGKPEEATRGTIHSVVVTRPGGTQISISSSAATPDQALTLDELESIALTPGLEL